VNKSTKYWFAVTLSILIGLLIVMPLLWSTMVYFDVYPNSDQVLMIRPYVFRVDDIINDVVPSRARYCVAIASRLEARTKATWSQLNQYYNKRWNRISNSGVFPIWNFKLSISTLGVFAFKIIEDENHTESFYKFYGLRSEIDFCTLNNWYQY
jgi:hypothetical protein